MEFQDTLLQINTALGKISTDIEYIKADITDLKLKDKDADKKLESTMTKVQKQQEMLREDIQHQLDAQRLLITTLTDRVSNIEGQKAKVLVKWYDKVVDKVVWTALATIGVLIVKYLGVM